VVQLSFGLQNAPSASSGGQAPWSVSTYLPTGTAKFDLSMFLDAGTDGLTATIEYDAERYEDALARQLGEGFRAVLGAAVADCDGPVGALPLTRRAPDEPPPGLYVAEQIDLAAHQLERLAAGASG
jgi:hypothetical protein